MSQKSYVSMEQHICVVCGKAFDTNAILLDKRLKDSMEQHTITGWGMCEEHEQLRVDGYVALVGVDESKSKISGSAIKPADAYRTGNIAHIRMAVWEQVFNFPAPDRKVAFVQDEVIDILKQRMAQDANEAGEG
jgi:hypothetical protein